MVARFIYFNGHYLDYVQAQRAVHSEDRGFLFADAIYEVHVVKEGISLEMNLHFERMQKGLENLGILSPFFSYQQYGWIVEELIEKNHLKTGIIYTQVSRGVSSPRNHIPARSLKPTVFLKAQYVPYMRSYCSECSKEDLSVASCIAMEDLRWKRCDIKSTSLLPNILGRQRAFEQGCQEAIFYNDQGYITEGAAVNLYLIKDIQPNIIYTSPLTQNILSGITRARILEIAPTMGYEVKEIPFTLEDVFQAKEFFLTSTTLWIKPIVEVNGKKIAKGRIGDVSFELFKAYARFMENAAVYHNKNEEYIKI